MKSIKTYLIESIQPIRLTESEIHKIDYKILNKTISIIYNYIFMFNVNNKGFRNLPYYGKLVNLKLDEQRRYIVKNINNFKEYVNYAYNPSAEFDISPNTEITDMYPDYKGYTFLKFIVCGAISCLQPNVHKKEIEEYARIFNNRILAIYPEIKVGIDNDLSLPEFEKYFKTGKLPKNKPNYDGDIDDIDPEIEEQLEKFISDELNSILDGYTCYIPSYDNEAGEEEVSWEEAIDSGYYSNIIDFLDAEFNNWKEDIYKTLKNNKSLKLNGINKNDIMAVIERTAENI